MCPPRTHTNYNFVEIGTADFKTLDGEIGLLHQSKVVKIDVEGHELRVLAGGEKFFTSGTPPAAVALEYVALSATDQVVLWQMMVRYGYHEQAKSKENVLFVRL